MEEWFKHNTIDVTEDYQWAQIDAKFYCEEATWNQAMAYRFWQRARERRLTCTIWIKARERAIEDLEAASWRFLFIEEERKQNGQD